MLKTIKLDHGALGGECRRDYATNVLGGFGNMLIMRSMATC